MVAIDKKVTKSKPLCTLVRNNDGPLTLLSHSQASPTLDSQHDSPSQGTTLDSQYDSPSQMDTHASHDYITTERHQDPKASIPMDTVRAPVALQATTSRKLAIDSASSGNYFPL